MYTLLLSHLYFYIHTHNTPITVHPGIGIKLDLCYISLELIPFSFFFVKHMGEDPTTIYSWILLLEVSISLSGSELTIESLTAVGALFVLLVMSEPSCDGSIWGTLLRLGQWNQLSVFFLCGLPVRR